MVLLHARALLLGMSQLLLLFIAEPAAAAFVNCTKQYHPSLLENRWVQNIAHWQSDDQRWPEGCKAWEQDKAAWDVWMTALNSSNATHSLPHDIFSYFLVRCPEQRPHRMYIEPLASMLRTPKYYCGKADLFDTSFLAFPWATQFKHNRAYFFDLGSTYFDAGYAGHRDSLSFFMDKYKSQGITFDQIYAWEMRPANHEDYWRRVPLEYKLKLHFFNTACSSEPNNEMNPLRLIERLTQPNDFVVVKLDIDNNPVEVSLVMQILESPLLLLLIDEMFWENHVKGSPIQWVGWGNLTQLTGPVSDLASSYATFSRLRHAGVRAHSWV